MRKRIIISLLCGMLLMSGCSGKPKDMSDEVYEIGTQALEIIEKYNDIEITTDEAQLRIDKLYDQIEEIEEENPDDKYASTISSDILLIKLGISSDSELSQYEQFLKNDLGK